MRKFVLIVTVLAIVVTGCVAQKAAVTVEENQVHFAIPNLTLELDAAYKYRDIGKDGGFSFFSDGGISGSGIDSEQHLFSKEGGPVDEQRWIHIAFSTIRTARAYFHPVNYSVSDGYIQVGEETLDGAKFKYAIYTSNSQSGVCYLEKKMAKTVGAASNKMLTITYVEEAGYSSDFPYRCNDWENPQNLSQAQKDRLEEFLENSRKEVKAAL